MTRNLGINEEEDQQDFDKCHCVEPVKIVSKLPEYSSSHAIKGRSLKKRKTAKNKKKKKIKLNFH